MVTSPGAGWYLKGWSVWETFLPLPCHDWRQTLFQHPVIRNIRKISFNLCRGHTVTIVKPTIHQLEPHRTHNSELVQLTRLFPVLTVQIFRRSLTVIQVYILWFNWESYEIESVSKDRKFHFFFFFFFFSPSLRFLRSNKKISDSKCFCFPSSERDMTKLYLPSSVLIYPLRSTQV